MTQSNVAPRPLTNWRTPTVVIVCGCLIAMVSFGPRSALGFFLTPLSSTNGWGREVFAFAVAIQNLLWGVGQPFAGAVADRFGTDRVLMIGAVFYAAGLALMAHSTTPGMIDLSAGVLIGLGLSGCSFNIVLGAFGKLLPEKSRSMAFGIGTAAGSFGQFLFSPVAVAIMDATTWQVALYAFASVILVIIPLAAALATPPQQVASASAPTPAAQNSLKVALAEAFGHRS
jgi:MFS family permease